MILECRVEVLDFDKAFHLMSTVLVETLDEVIIVVAAHVLHMALHRQVVILRRLSLRKQHVLFEPSEIGFIDAEITLRDGVLALFLDANIVVVVLILCLLR